jgi:hypothetical protein
MIPEDEIPIEQEAEEALAQTVEESVRQDLQRDKGLQDPPDQVFVIPLTRDGALFPCDGCPLSDRAWSLL